jgi:hypothetical protein
MLEAPVVQVVDERLHSEGGQVAALDFQSL